MLNLKAAREQVATWLDREGLAFGVFKSLNPKP